MKGKSISESVDEILASHLIFEKSINFRRGRKRLLKFWHFAYILH